MVLADAYACCAHHVQGRRRWVGSWLALGTTGMLQESYRNLQEAIWIRARIEGMLGISSRSGETGTVRDRATRDARRGRRGDCPTASPSGGRSILILYKATASRCPLATAHPPPRGPFSPRFFRLTNRSVNRRSSHIGHRARGARTSVSTTKPVPLALHLTLTRGRGRVAGLGEALSHAFYVTLVQTSPRRPPSVPHIPPRPSMCQRRPTRTPRRPDRFSRRDFGSPWRRKGAQDGQERRPEHRDELHLAGYPRRQGQCHGVFS